MIQSRPGRARARGLLLTCVSGALLASQLAGGPAAAQSKEELDKARATFLEGVSLAAANNCAAALAKYQAVAKVKVTAQVAYNIAECEERLGKLVPALGSYRLAASLVTDGKPKEVSSNVGDRIKSLEARMPTLILQRTEQTARIELDGIEIGSMGAEIPVDPGTHTVSGKIGETEVWRESVQIAEKEHKTVTVKIDLAKFKPPTQPTATATAVATVAPPPTATVEPPPPASKAPAFVVGAIGIASLGAGVGLFVASRGNAAELEKLCGKDNDCPASAKGTYDSGRTLTGVSEALFAVGVVGVAAGIVLYVVRGSGDKPPPATGAARAAPKPEIGVSAHGGAGSGGLSIVGRF
jgi:hypothetical protein